MSFDDDDNPAIVAGPPSAGGADGAAAAEEAMEDEMPDYKLFMSMFDKRGVSSKSIRKGEKDFESHGTRAQDGVLETSRRALEDVLSYTRIHRGDGWVRGWYVPDFWSAHDAESVGLLDPKQDDGRLMLRDRVVVVEHERGSWMKDIGRSVPAGINSTEAQKPGIGRLWLLPEEALHMVERGTLDLWWPYRDLGELLAPGEASGPDDYDVGIPLSLEAAYSLLLGEEGEGGKISLPRYQVFTHLKRGGFHVLRAPEEQGDARLADTAQTTSNTPGAALLEWLLTLVGWGRDVQQQTEPKKHSFGPLVSPGLYRAYTPVYEQLSLLPRHRPQRRLTFTHQEDNVSSSSSSSSSLSSSRSPYEVFFHVWKSGGAPFSKRSPPTPNFRVAVSDTGLHSLPTLEEMSALLESTPLDEPSSNPAWKGPGRLYQRLKHGHRNVLVAVVDRGLVNYMRFGEGAFGEERLYERLDAARRGGRGGGAGAGGKRGGGRGRGRGGRGRGRGR